MSNRRDQIWYRSKVKEPIADRLLPLVSRLLANESTFHSKNIARQRIYRGSWFDQRAGRKPNQAPFGAAITALAKAGIGVARLNATKALCDTFSSRLMKDRPMPSFVTDDSDWDLKSKAKKYRGFIVGQMLETEFDDLSRRAVDDGTRLGFAYTGIDEADDAILAERIHQNDIIFDRRECKYGKPQQAFRIHRVSRDYLAELYPEFEDYILNEAPASEPRQSDTNNPDDGPSITDLADYVDTWTAYHLPSTSDSDDGRKAIICGQKTLVHEKWWEPRFPWSMFQIDDPDDGMYPIGFVDDLIEMQYRVNCIVRDIQLNLMVTGRGHYMTNDVNRLPVEMMNAMQPFEMVYNGPRESAPVWTAPQPYNMAQMSALDKFIDFMFSMKGVSKANAESRSALGAGASGIALDTQYDIDSDRFRGPQSKYARYRLHGAQCYLDASKRVARRRAENGKRRSWVATTWKGRDAIQKLDYSAVELKEGSYRLAIEAVGFLPDTRAGKLSAVQQLAQAGIIPQWMVPMLFDEPDLSEANRVLLAPIKWCLKKMEMLIDVTIDAPMPEQYDELDLELKISKAYYAWIRCENAPLDVQGRYTDYIASVVEAIAQYQPAPPPQLPMSPPQSPMPGGVPMMPQGPVPAPTPIGSMAPPMVS